MKDFLGFSAQEPSAVCFTTEALLLFTTETFELVVEGDFLSRRNVFLGKDTHPYLLVHHPLVCFRIGIARMVDKASQVALL